MRSRLHVPRPPARPGEKPDFSYVGVSPAGAAARPDPNAPLSETEFLSREMVRVLDDNGRAVGPW
ncbi:MAG: 3-methyl-2-oxobutanoate dehydrogenase (2-methylpropanoyl-transferring) subunit alpha, partial [Pseudomonadota bacterium]|nr:3-methyl-2-oxobutanoate dehydrogenase (2-methylpropanoyl-transferring) subunit alpha [Pseudomonadota bacterium]